MDNFDEEIDGVYEPSTSDLTNAILGRFSSWFGRFFVYAAF